MFGDKNCWCRGQFNWRDPNCLIAIQPITTNGEIARYKDGRLEIDPIVTCNDCGRVMGPVRVL